MRFANEEGDDDNVDDVDYDGDDCVDDVNSNSVGNFWLLRSLNYGQNIMGK